MSDKENNHNPTSFFIEDLVNFNSVNEAKDVFLKALNELLEKVEEDFGSEEVKKEILKKLMVESLKKQGLQEQIVKNNAVSLALEESDDEIRTTSTRPSKRRHVTFELSSQESVSSQSSGEVYVPEEEEDDDCDNGEELKYILSVDEIVPVEIAGVVYTMDDHKDLIARLNLSSVIFADLSSSSFLKRISLPKHQKKIIEKWQDTIEDEDEDYFVLPKSKDDILLTNLLNTSYNNIMNENRLLRLNHDLKSKEDISNEEEDYKMKFVAPLLNNLFTHKNNVILCGILIQTSMKNLQVSL